MHDVPKTLPHVRLLCFNFLALLLPQIENIFGASDRKYLIKRNDETNMFDGLTWFAHKHKTEYAVKDLEPDAGVSNPPNHLWLHKNLG